MTSLQMYKAPQMTFKAIKTMGYAVGALVILMALTVYITQMELSSILAWLEEVFSVSFVVIYLGLMTLGVYAGFRIRNEGQNAYWHEIGQQSAGGVATLALTFTLLGLSLGIGSLADKDITPDSIQQIIQGLTYHFSTAFMTTVVGLPSANILRAFVSISWVQKANT